MHGDKYAYDCEAGSLYETKYLFVPPADKEVTKPGYVDELSVLSDDQLREVERLLRLKINKA